MLTVIEEDAPLSVERKHGKLLLRVRPGMGEQARQAVVEEWYRRLLKQEAPPLIGVKVERFFVQRMKTKWGSCNHAASTIRLNTSSSTKWFACWSRPTAPASSR
jgi:predicted metal-dependent hydrolase